MLCRFAWTKEGMVAHSQGAYVRACDGQYADELLEACKRLLSHTAERNDDYDAVSAAESVIKKAEGC